MGKYDDIINLARPKSNRPPMPVADRAKIFMPFAALKGYEEAIEEKQKLTFPRIELSEEQKEVLDKKLHTLEEEMSLGNRPKITVRYYVVDDKVSRQEGRELGIYAELSGTVSKVDALFGTIRISDTVIALSDVQDITDELPEE